MLGGNCIMRSLTAASGQCAGTCSYSSHGVAFAIHTSDAALRDRICEYLPPGWREHPYSDTHPLYVLSRSEAAKTGEPLYDLSYRPARNRSQRRIARDLDQPAALQRLESALHAKVAEGAVGYLFVHAGVVGWRGQAIVIPGRSGSGKSSLVAALVRSGAAYYSDEYAVVTADGRVQPYTKPLNSRVVGQPSRRISSTMLGGPVGVDPLPIGVILLTRYHAGARWGLRGISPGLATLGMLANTVAARKNPSIALAILHRASVNARALLGDRGEATEGGEIILGRHAREYVA